MKDGRRKGEWWEVPLSEEEKAEQDPGRWMDRLCRQAAVSLKWLSGLRHSGGMRLQGNRLLLKLFPEEALPFAPDWTMIDVLYEDDFCLVAAKPAGMKVHPTFEGESGTLLQAVAGHLQAAGEAVRPRHIHRLDEQTTGPVLFAKCDWAQQSLDAAMREKRVERLYAALVQGRLAKREGTIDAPIGRDRHHPSRRRVSPGGSPAVTRFAVAELLPSASLVRLRLETGRTHQIRVHLSHAGHPLLGDTLYGGRAAGIGRQALHGERLVFPHPWTGEIVETAADWPDDFRSLYERLKNS